MKYSQWNINKYDQCAADSMIGGEIPVLAAMVLASRGIENVEQARAFIDMDIESFEHPFMLKDMDKAVERIRHAREREETVAVYGDYDVDGITSLALMLHCLRDAGYKCVPYIPDRIGEGYGLNIEAIDYLKTQGVSLIITVDCGITAVQEVDYAASLGIDVVITDHHECKERLPDAVAVVNPKRPDCPYPFKNLAGVGVAYKLLCALFDKYSELQPLKHYSPLVAMGTVADVMPLIGENRAIVRMGLKEMEHTDIVGLDTLLKANGLKGKKILSTNVSFSLAPKINAAGRMGSAKVAVDLLMTQDSDEAEWLTEELGQLNRERQQIENGIYKQAVEMLEQQGDGVVVLANEGWHQGVIGIVASKLAEKQKAPAFLISLDGDNGKASCRSYGGFNLFLALEKASPLLESFGGHALAAGFTIKRENIPAFKKMMDEIFMCYSQENTMKSELDIDCLIEDCSLLTLDNVDGLRVLEPFGTGNTSPVFCMKDMYVFTAGDIGSGRHLKMTLMKDDSSFEAVFFSQTMASAGVAMGDQVDIAFYPIINEYKGRTSVQLMITDICPNENTLQLEYRYMDIFEKYRLCQPLTAWEAGKLIPPREGFVAIWRYLKNRSNNGCVSGEKGYLSREIARVASMPPNITRMLICLDVFRDLGLVEFSENGDNISVKLCHVDGKVNLNNSSIMKKLKDISGK